MLTLYAAIGNYRLTEKGLPLVTAGGRDCALDVTRHFVVDGKSILFSTV